MNLDILNLNNKIEGVDRVNEIMFGLVDGKNIAPKPITYIDIDSEMKNFVSTKFNVEFSKNEIKTFLFSQQRMSEITKTWEVVDENKNVLPPFKIITRENNPKPGTMQGGFMNIPGEIYFDIGSFDKWDGENKITVTYKMKQPYCIDIIYNIKFVTNRLNLINELNNKVNEEFKAKQAYLKVNGHFMPVTLEDIGDESDYDLDQRKIFVQNYQLKVSGYIINEKDIIIEENMIRSLIGIEIDTRKPNLVINKENNNIIVEFPRKSKVIMSFRSDSDYHIIGVETSSSNVLSYMIAVNGELVSNDFYLKKYDRIQVRIERESRNELSKITLITQSN